jgi:hypothetical protein
MSIVPTVCIVAPPLFVLLSPALPHLLHTPSHPFPLRISNAPTLRFAAPPLRVSMHLLCMSAHPYIPLRVSRIHRISMYPFACHAPIAYLCTPSRVAHLGMSMHPFACHAPYHISMHPFACHAPYRISMHPFAHRAPMYVYAPLRASRTYAYLWRYFCTFIIFPCNLVARYIPSRVLIISPCFLHSNCSPHFLCARFQVPSVQPC